VTLEYRHRAINSKEGNSCEDICTKNEEVRDGCRKTAGVVYFLLFALNIIAMTKPSMMI
jgi:hypothetical protein